MNAHDSRTWLSLRTSYWFVPSAMLAGAFVLAIVMLQLDEIMQDELIRRLPWLYGGGPEGARGILSTIAGSMITIAGVIFSITIVSLTLASRQFGPRVLRNFMRDTGNQVALGTFISAFLYSLIVLKGVRQQDSGLFVPQLSLTLAILLAVAGLAVLIFFIHHVATAIQAPNIVAAIAGDLMQSINRIFPAKLGQAPSESRKTIPLPKGFEEKAYPVRSVSSGYVQEVNSDKLLRTASQEDLIVRLVKRPGAFVAEGEILLLAWPGDRINQSMAGRLRRSVLLGKQRTIEQNAEFAFDQLAQIFLRALSPSLNDIATAANCIDRLEAGFRLLAQREIPSPYRLDAKGRLRVIADPSTFEGIFGTILDRIRPLASTNSVIARRLLEMIIAIFAIARRPEDRRILLDHALLLERAALNELKEERDKRRIAESLRRMQ